MNPSSTNGVVDGWPRPPEGTGGVAAQTELERAVAAVRTDPTVRAVVEHLWRTRSCTIDDAHLGGTYIRGEDDALLWVAWDAFHAVEWGRDPLLCPCQPATTGEAIMSAFFDSGLHDPDNPEPSLAGDLLVVMEAIGAFG